MFNFIFPPLHLYIANVISQRMLRPGSDSEAAIADALVSSNLFFFPFSSLHYLSLEFFYLSWPVLNGFTFLYSDMHIWHCKFYAQGFVAKRISYLKCKKKKHNLMLAMDLVEVFYHLTTERCWDKYLSFFFLIFGKSNKVDVLFVNKKCVFACDLFYSIILHKVYSMKDLVWGLRCLFLPLNICFVIL